MLAIRVRHVVLDDADAEAEKAVDLTHPVRVAAGQVIVDGDDVDALALQRVEIDRQGGHQRLALAGLHLGDAAAMEDHATHELDVERAHMDRAPGGLAGHGEGRNQEIIRGGSGRDLVLEFNGLGPQPGVRESLDLRLHLVDRRHARQQLLDFPLMLAAKYLGQNRIDHRDLTWDAAWGQDGST